MKNLRLATSLALLLLACTATAQSVTVRGIVVDSIDRQPLPFVNLSVDGDRYRGTFTDPDGRYSLELQPGDRYVEFRYVGYRTMRVPTAELKQGLAMVVMARGGIVLETVEVKAGENPAHRIIQRVIDNRRQHDPTRYNNFRYKAYDKMVLTESSQLKDDFIERGAMFDSVITWMRKLEGDTTRSTILDSINLFLMETVSERNFANGKDNTTVLGTRASGLSRPEFFILATQLQPFTFYKEDIELLETKYANPIAPGTFSRYFFHLEDTLWSGADTVFVISFKPYSHRHFTALQGMLYVNTNGYAIQQVQAGPARLEGLQVRMLQQYGQVNGRWFPLRLHTDMLFPTLVINKTPASIITRSYLTDIHVDEAMPERVRNRYNIRIDPASARRDDSFFIRHRYDTLTVKERATYRVVDSFGQEMNLDRKVRWAMTLVRGSVRTGPIEWPLADWIGLNSYEGLRLGARARTNDNFAERIRLEAFGAYGFRDKAVKYGGSAAYQLWPAADMWLKAGYHNDVFESGVYQAWLVPRKPNFLETIRKYLVGDMYTEQAWQASVQAQVLPALLVEPFGRVGSWQTVMDYHLMQFGSDGLGVALYPYYFTEAGVRLRWAPGEKLARVGNRTERLGTNYPIVWLNVAKGLEAGQGTLNYLKAEALATYTHRWRGTMSTTVNLRGGMAEGALPYFMLFMGRGTQRERSFYVIEDAFHTMPVHGYLSDRYTGILLKHNFGIVVKKGFFQPQLVLQGGALWGTLQEPASHSGINFRVPKLGYYEGGLVIHNIVVTKGPLGKNGFGVGAFYHFGPYAVSDWRENLALRVAYRLGL